MNLHTDQATLDRWRTDGRWEMFRAGVERAWGFGYDREWIAGPPAEFVEWAKPCETCEANRARFIGYGWVPEAAAIQGAVGCPDCIDGRQRHTITVPCGMCDGEGIWCGHCQRPWRSRYCDPLHNSQRITCRFCQDGRIAVPELAVVEWGPAEVRPPGDNQDEGSYAIGGKLVTP